MGSYNNDTGALQELRQMRGESISPEDSVSAIEWDSYGNLSRITDSGGAYVAYKYDDGELRQYVNEITAGGKGVAGYKSRMEWDYSFGQKAKETDENGQSINYVYDGYGRLTEVWSPYDRYRQGGTTPAVRYRYALTEEESVNQPKAIAKENWYAVTENKIQFDYRNTDTLSTVVMIDGLRRVIYTAKQGEVYDNGTNREGWNVSGFTSYDAKGRSVRTGQPLFVGIKDAESLASWNMRDREVLLNPTKQSYDSLDRVIETVLPSAPFTEPVVQTTRHSIRNGSTWAITKDPLGNITEQGSGSRGNITRVNRLDRYGKEMAHASYAYNGLGELLTARDAEGNPLTVEYDRLGRRTKLSSPDIGTRQFWYDASGNMVEESNSELVKQGKRIEYKYDGMNRLLRINYPYSEPTVYEYGEYKEGGREDNAAGRITKVTDESGTINYRYGLLGQVDEEARVIKLLPLSGNKTKAAAMKYLSDYLGRMQEISYPDGEKVKYEYNYGGQITSVTGVRQSTEFKYVKAIGYDEYSQMVFVEYGNGVKTNYSYDPYRRWLSALETNSPTAGVAQDLSYKFDAVGNVKGYENKSRAYTTSQDYAYDALHQLIEVRGESRSHPGGIGGNTEYSTSYRQEYAFNAIGNMTGKVSKEDISNTNRIGMDLNYSLDYAYYPGTHKAERIGERYYSYDLNGNLVAERDGGHAVDAQVYRPYYQDGDLYWTDYGFGLVKPEGNKQSDGVYQRNYKWNERNLMSESSDSGYTLQYRYGSDGQRALKFVVNTRRTTLYFNKMWQMSDATADWLHGKHVYVGEDRIATKYSSEGNLNTEAEKTRVYYYHSDHLGSAQVVTNHNGLLHERLEYTPYGELWIDWKSDLAPEDGTPFRFTGKEMDAETKLYYYGARYLDPRTSRWLSVDPAMGEYIPGAPVDDEVRRKNQNLPNGGIFNYISLHVYNYSNNNPIGFLDPNGEEPKLATAWNAANLDFGRDYMGLAQANFSEGHYGWAALMVGDALAEAAYDTFGFFSVASLAGRIGAGTVSASTVATATGSASVWALKPFERGRTIEQSLGMNLPSNFPTIDKFINGVATSIKSLDLGAKSYQNMSKLTSTLTKYVNSVASFNGRQWGNANVPASQITSRALELAVPSLGTAAQQAALQNVAAYAKSVGVDLIITVIP